MEKRLVRITVLAAVLFFGVASGWAFALDSGLPDAAVLSKLVNKKPGYSPYAGRDFPTRPFFGDTHVHTATSFDAGAFGTTLGPRDAYRFARGPKKSGKTTLAAMIVIYVIVVLGGRFGEGYCIANDHEQSLGRVFQQIQRIIKASPHLNQSAKILSSKIEFFATGATITALASDYAGAAGANPTIVVFDELWGYVSESSHRLWDEMVPVPTRKISMRLTVTYAGFSGESDLLWNLYQRGLQGEAA